MLHSHITSRFRVLGTYFEITCDPHFLKLVGSIYQRENYNPKFKLIMIISALFFMIKYLAFETNGYDINQVRLT